jgi:hypothetical protein
MAFDFNPITGQLDLVGSGGGSSYIDGVVADSSLLPVTLGTPALDAVYLAKAGSGVWLINRKPAGLYVRVANNGVAADWTYLGAFPEVNADGNWELYNTADPTKELKFDLSGITTGTTRTITVPDKNVTLDDAGDTRDPNAHAASHAAAGGDPVFDQDLNILDNVTFGSVTTDVVTCSAFADAAENTQLQFDDGVHRLINNAAETVTVSDSDASFQVPIAFGGDNAATNAATTRDNLGLGDAATADIGTAAGTVAAGDHTHELNALDATGITAGKVLVADGDDTASWQDAPSGGDTVSINASAADVLSVSSGAISAVDATADKIVFYDDSASELTYLELGSGLSITDQTLSATATGTIGGSTSTDNAIVRADSTSNTVQDSALVIDDATTSTQANVALRNNHSETNSALVLTPKGTGAFILGPKPDGTSVGGNARGANSIDIQLTRTNANQVASGSACVAIGTGCRAASNDAVVIGTSAVSTAIRNVAIGYSANAAAEDGVAIGQLSAATGNRGIALGRIARAERRAEFATLPFNAIYWGGQTTNDTATVLNLDAIATNRFTIAANTALAVDILLVARRSDTADKWLVARRFLGIRRDGSNNTSLIGSVQTLGTDQSEGSPSWSFTLTADDTNEALQLEVTGAASETVQWRATAFYRVV